MKSKFSLRQNQRIHVDCVKLQIVTVSQRTCYSGLAGDISSVQGLTEAATVKTPEKVSLTFYLPFQLPINTWGSETGQVASVKWSK